MQQSIIFWRSGPDVTQSAAAICQELSFGEDVEGLVDLPIKEVIDRIKAAFEQVDERSGMLIVGGKAGTFEVTWTWQFFRIDALELTAFDRERLYTIGREFECQWHEPKSTFPMR